MEIARILQGECSTAELHLSDRTMDRHIMQLKDR